MWVYSPPNHNHYEKVYITRKNAKYRKVINEDELLNIINEHKFEIVDLDTISIIEQIKIFNSAKIIVGIHGAGLANIFFCKSGSRLLEIYPYNYFDPGFRLLAITLNIHYDYIIGSETDCDTDPQKTNIYIDSELFKTALIKFEQD